MNRTTDGHYLLNCSGRLLDLRSSAAVMGIVNLTPDSFSDGGMFQEPGGRADLSRAVEYALSMVRDGALIIDIGGESTRPGASRVSADEEIRRTIPFISLLRKKSEVLISIDTYKSEVAEAALDAGAQIVNDISGFTFDRNLPSICRKYHAAAILMHTPITPDSMKWSTQTHSAGSDVTGTVTKFLQKAVASAEHAGIDDIIIDPGFGFGKSVNENFRLLGSISQLLELERPLLAGVSRKSFLGHAIRKNGEPEPPPAARYDATAAAQTIALMHGAAIIRTHDVRAAFHAVSIVSAMKRAIA
ncbi:MAG: dihydropteroate synthase [Chlorobium limicola]|jgi:dihydropteroate synthase|uniref:Dihydropteroate synthase n=1 Tax=Chlorobium limicola (strain DSM 245 / NBRC 103803 / 6330) TaxID=290315 RepID=B3EFQ5_CHLL2|nr:dihydropteroate synthase [Chlorobium limicola]ACD91017.1 dihydropteroate synthase [Chlorobium limicola DSM 245]NTV21260.1 dihydropteroate synthase [Chlorobium limicola]